MAGSVHAGPTTGRRSRWRAAVAAVGLLGAAATVVLPAAPAAASLTPSTFQANDGDLVVASTATQKDWVNAPAFRYGVDKPTGQKDDSFKGGMYEDTVDPAVGTGAIPNSKDDLARFYVANENLTTSSGPADFLYLAWLRYKTSGSADIDFELNQSAQKAANGLPVRTAGDRLVSYEFIASKSPQLSLLTWLTAPGSTCDASKSTPPCWGARNDLNATNSEGAVNDGFSVKDPTAPGKGATLASQTFGEAALNLTALGVFTSDRCTSFAQVYAKTRSSQSFPSSLQDLIAPVPVSISSCATKTFTLTYGSPVPAGLTPYAVYTTPDGVTHALALAAGTNAGTFTAKDTAIEPGSVLTGVHLELRTGAGAVAWRSSPDQTETIDRDTTNSASFSYALDLTPRSAENFAGRPHVLTATLTGTGTLNGVTSTAPLAGVPVRFATYAGTPAGCGSLSPTTGTTDAAGHATTTLTSPSACSTSVRAWVDSAGGTSGFDTGEVAATATKTFVAYAVTVTPASATNALGTNHTFTVALTRDTGSGPAGYAGRTVSLVLNDPDGTGAHLVSVNGTAASGTSATCTTSSTGTCAVVATATRTGTFTLGASYTTANDSGQGTFTGTGTKSYVDFRVRVSPLTATNEVGVPHTFTAVLERDSGSGFAPLAGQPLTLSLDPGTGNGHLTAVNGTATSGLTGSCTTRTDGTCAVTIVATTPGLATLTSRYSTTLDSGTLTRSGSATKQYAAFALAVSPRTAVNALGVPHTFTVTLTRDDGAGPVGYAGQQVALSLAPGSTDAHLTDVDGSPASGTTAICTTSTAGTCAVTIVATTPGTATLTARWSTALTDSTATRTASATKSYVALSASKASCANAAPLGGLVRFDIPWSTAGAALTGAQVVDDLPPGLLYQGASTAPSSAPAVGQSGRVVFALPSPLPDPASGTVSVVASIAQSVPLGTVLTNTGALTADGGLSKAFSASVTASSAGAAASGRAYGLTAQALGTTLVAPTPDVTQGATSAASLAVPPLAPTLLTGSTGLLSVANTPALSATGARDTASATTANVDLTVAGVSVKAALVAARSDSSADGTTAGTSTTGSQVLGLSVNGSTAQDVSSPRVITVVNAVGQTVEVSVLENAGASGAALGGAAGAQPQSGLFRSGLTVNGLHVRVLGSTVEAVVSHAESAAAFPTLTPCSGTGPYVVGSAAVARELLTHPTGPTSVTVDGVLLPSAGGDVLSSASSADLAVIGATAGSGAAETKGALSPLGATSTAQLQRLALPGLTASTISVSTQAGSGSPVLSTSLAKVVVGSTDVCQALGLTSTCTPAVNTRLLDSTRTVLVVLNEQSVVAGVASVTGVHVYVLGAGNPLGLPVGSELLLSTATAGTG